MRIVFRSEGKEAVSSGKQSATWATKSMRSWKETMPVEVAVVGEARKMSRWDWYWPYWFKKSSLYDLQIVSLNFQNLKRCEDLLWIPSNFVLEIGTVAVSIGTRGIGVGRLTDLHQPSPVRRLVSCPLLLWVFGERRVAVASIVGFYREIFLLSFILASKDPASSKAVSRASATPP